MVNPANEKNKHLGSTLEDFLRAEGIYEETKATALARVIAWLKRGARVQIELQDGKRGAVVEE